MLSLVLLYDLLCAVDMEMTFRDCYVVLRHLRRYTRVSGVPRAASPRPQCVRLAAAKYDPSKAAVQTNGLIRFRF